MAERVCEDYFIPMQVTFRINGFLSFSFVVHPRRYCMEGITKPQEMGNPGFQVGLHH